MKTDSVSEFRSVSQAWFIEVFIWKWSRAYYRLAYRESLTSETHGAFDISNENSIRAVCVLDLHRPVIISLSASHARPSFVQSDLSFLLSSGVSPVSRFLGTLPAMRGNVRGDQSIRVSQDGRKEETPGGSHLTTSGTSERAQIRIRFGCQKRSRARLLSAPDDDYSSHGVWTDRVLFPPPSPPRAIVTTTFRADARSRTYHTPLRAALRNNNS